MRATSAGANATLILGAPLQCPGKALQRNAAPLVPGGPAKARGSTFRPPPCPATRRAAAARPGYGCNGGSGGAQYLPISSWMTTFIAAHPNREVIISIHHLRIR